MKIDEIQHPKVTAYDRAKILASRWICGGIKTNPTERERKAIEDLATLIYQELELQDCDTRHTIAEEISAFPPNGYHGGIKEQSMAYMFKNCAHSIVMNTKAL